MSSNYQDQVARRTELSVAVIAKELAALRKLVTGIEAYLHGLAMRERKDAKVFVERMDSFFYDMALRESGER